MSRAQPPASEGRAVITRSRLLGGITLLVAAAVVVIVILPRGSSSPSHSRSGSRVNGSATVKSRNLVETDTESGTLSYAHAHTVYDRLSGTLTWLPEVGRVIKPGHTLFEVNNEPVILLDGRTPAYRDLKSSDSDGPDIMELNRNLVELGYNPDEIDVESHWQPATTAGVEQLQKALGLSQTGTLPLGRIVFLPGRQLVNTIDATLGSRVSLDSATPRTDFVDYTSTPITRTAVDGGSGSVGGPLTAILRTSSTRLVVTVDLPASSQSEAVVGQRVTVEMPNGSTVRGRISTVSKIAQRSSSGGGGGSDSAAGSGNTGSRSSTIPVTISLEKRVNGTGLDQAAVSVNFAQAKAKHVLSVPVTALIATPGDKYAVQEAGPPHRLLPVQTGLFAAGYVQISGARIRAGLRVTDSQG
jgi:peptidoglycan hydrolase-like protein with peptidoglycan-binding domain